MIANGGGIRTREARHVSMAELAPSPHVRVREYQNSRKYGPDEVVSATHPRRAINQHQDTKKTDGGLACDQMSPAIFEQWQRYQFVWRCFWQGIEFYRENHKSGVPEGAD